MILSDRDIRARLAKGDLVVDPLDDPDLQVQPASIDLRLGGEFLVFRTPHVPFIDPFEKGSEAYTEPVTVEDGGTFIMHPGEFALGTTLERVKLPDDLVARVEGRSSLGRLAIVVHATAGFLDPGFEGRITLELSNLGRIPVALRPRMRVSQIAIYQMTSPAERPYGHPSRGSKYQGQEGPVASRIASDRPAAPRKP
jgi:dCTP deaminase